MHRGTFSTGLYTDRLKEMTALYHAYIGGFRGIGRKEIGME